MERKLLKKRTHALEKKVITWQCYPKEWMCNIIANENYDRYKDGGGGGKKKKIVFYIFWKNLTLKLLI
jgi:hypothetical protein